MTRRWQRPSSWANPEEVVRARQGRPAFVVNRLLTRLGEVTKSVDEGTLRGRRSGTRPIGAAMSPFTLLQACGTGGRLPRVGDHARGLSRPVLRLGQPEEDRGGRQDRDLDLRQRDARDRPEVAELFEQGDARSVRSRCVTGR